MPFHCSNPRNENAHLPHPRNLKVQLAHTLIIPRLLLPRVLRKHCFNFPLAARPRPNLAPKLLKTRYVVEVHASLLVQSRLATPHVRAHNHRAWPFHQLDDCSPSIELLLPREKVQERQYLQDIDARKQRLQRRRRPRRAIPLQQIEQIRRHKRSPQRTRRPTFLCAVTEQLVAYLVVLAVEFQHPTSKNFAFGALNRETMERYEGVYGSARVRKRNCPIHGKGQTSQASSRCADLVRRTFLKA